MPFSLLVIYLFYCVPHNEIDIDTSQLEFKGNYIVTSWGKCQSLELNKVVKIVSLYFYSNPDNGQSMEHLQFLNQRLYKKYMTKVDMYKKGMDEAQFKSLN